MGGSSVLARAVEAEQPEHWLTAGAAQEAAVAYW
jgi:hypothetical protein